MTSTVIFGIIYDTGASEVSGKIFNENILSDTTVNIRISLIFKYLRSYDYYESPLTSKYGESKSSPATFFSGFPLLSNSVCSVYLRVSSSDIVTEDIFGNK